jgi:hypothetical protein
MVPRRVVRAGQWKLSRTGRGIEIELAKKILDAAYGPTTCVVSDPDRVVLHDSHRGIVGGQVGVVALPLAASANCPSGD